jgi:hypothetical protein
MDLYTKLSPRHRKIVDWTIREYTDIEKNSDKLIETDVYTIQSSIGEPINFKTPINQKISRRHLDNLDVLDFDFGLRFLCNKRYMPFFTDIDTALFKHQEPEVGDLCLVKFKLGGAHWLCFMEENGFFELDGSYLDDGTGIEIIGVLVNNESNK